MNGIQDDGEDLYGSQAAIEYSPVPALSLRAGVQDDSQSAPTLQAGLTFKWRFDQPEELQWRQRTELAPVEDYVYEKVQRSNLIRVQKQRKESSKLTVVNTSGANIAQDENGQNALFIGQTLLMPVTVTVANTGGAFARLRTANGGIITIAQNSSIRVEPRLITLITGSMQYVSDGVIQNVAVPGGVIVLHGTDIDVVSNGSNYSSVRVRSGRVSLTGSVSGTVTIESGEAAESNAGVVDTIATGGGAYVTHTDTISTLIDRIAPEQNGEKVTPYPIASPRIVSFTGTGVGAQVVIGQQFNTAVTVAGGTPRLNITINGNARTVDLTSGSGTDDLLFTYTIQVTDSGVTTMTVNGFDHNGATITGNGKAAVTSIADTVLTFSSAVGDITNPSGYAVAFTSDPVNIANVSAGALSITTAEVGTTYNYTISSSGGGTPVTGSGTVATATQSITGIDLSGLNDGTLTVSITLTDAGSNIGAAATDTVTKDVLAPLINSITPPANATYEP